MQKSERMAMLERELLDQRETIENALARVRGIEAELAALRAGPDQAELQSAPRTEAILTVLRRAEGTLGPSEILDRLRAGGRTDELRSITATLDHLVKRELVRRPERGRYYAT